MEIIMKKRSKIPKKASKKLFRKTAAKVKTKNHRAAPMRGGIRL